MKILNGFQLDYDMLLKTYSVDHYMLKALEGLVPRAQRNAGIMPAVDAPTATPSPTPSAPSGGGASPPPATGAPPQGAEQRKQGGKYIRRWWANGRWNYEYAGHGGSGGRMHESVTPVPAEHDTGVHAEQAYHNITGGVSAPSQETAVPQAPAVAPTEQAQPASYVKRTHLGGNKWNFEYATADQIGDHLGQAHFGDNHEHVLALPTGHDMSMNPEDAYHQTLSAAFSPGQEHVFNHPSPHHPQGTQLRLTIVPSGTGKKRHNRFQVFDQNGKMVSDQPNFASHEAWVRKQQSGAIILTGPTGKPWLSISPNVYTKGETGLMSPAGKSGKGDGGWSGKFILHDPNAPEDEQSDPDYVPDPELVREGDRAHPLEGTHRAVVLINAIRRIGQMEKYGNYQFPQETKDRINALINEEVARDPRVAQLLQERKEGRFKGQKRERMTTQEAHESRIALAEGDINREFTPQNYHFNERSGRVEFLPNEPEKRHQIIGKLLQDHKKDIKIALIKAIKQNSVNDPDNYIKNSLAEAFGFGNFDNLMSPHSEDALIQDVASNPNHPFYEKVSKLIESYDSHITHDGKFIKINTYLKNGIDKEIPQMVGTLKYGIVGDIKDADALTTAVGSPQERVVDPSELIPMSAEASREHARRMAEERAKFGGQGKPKKTPKKIRTHEEAMAEGQALRQRLAGGSAQEEPETSVEAEEEISPAVASDAPADLESWRNTQLDKLMDSYVKPTATTDDRKKLKTVIDELSGIETPAQLDKFEARYSDNPDIPGGYVPHNISENYWDDDDKVSEHAGQAKKFAKQKYPWFFKKSFDSIAIEAVKAELALRKALDPTFFSQDAKVDPSHVYSHMEGTADHPKFFYRDPAGNFLRYTNAPTGHPDHVDRMGEPELHGSEPTADKAPQFFDLKGRKMNRAPYPGADVLWNPNYHKNDPYNLWAARWVNPNSGEHEFAYLDQDFRNNPALKKHYEVVLTDVRIPFLRKKVMELSNSGNLKDKITSAALALIDQGRFRAPELASLSVADVVEFGSIYKIGNRYIYPDHALRSFLHMLITDRSPDEPLFAVPFVDRDFVPNTNILRKIGPNYLICTLDQLGLSFDGLQAYHATQTFAREALRYMTEQRAPWTAAKYYALFAVAQELGINISDEPDVEVALNIINDSFVDPVVVAVLEENAPNLTSQAVPNPVLPLPAPPVLHVSIDRATRTVEEDVFSKWIHTFPVHLTGGSAPSPTPQQDQLDTDLPASAYDSVSKSDKPFHGYNPKRHSRTGGLNAEFRAKYNREHGSNLKAPVTEKNPKGKKKARRASFCARMSGVPGPTSKDGKLTPKGAALKRWRCKSDATDLDILKYI